jgi:trk system potassium uptake protein TrkH
VPALRRISPLLPALSVLGILIAAFGLTMSVPLAVSHFSGDGMVRAWAAPMFVTIVMGLALWLMCRRGRRELQPRDGVLLVVMAWTFLPLFACFPLLGWAEISGRELSLTHAYFEAVSGLTTTGATVLTGLDDLPLSVNVWRTFLQWQGGLGILILAVAILPLLGVGGSQLFRAEAAGPLKDNKLTPRITETAKGLWTVYGVLSLLCVTAYWLGGMSAEDAWMHMFSTVSLGGLSSHDASFGYFDSPLLESMAVVFMLVASCNFALYFIAVKKRTWQPLLRDPELRGTLAVMIGSALLVGAMLAWRGTYPMLESFRHAMFNVISIASTTGYSTQDYLLWPVLPPVLMLMLSGLATSAGSTGCGIKMVRLLILLKQTSRELTRLIHPMAVRPVTLGGARIDNNVIFAVLGYMLVYGVTIIGLTMLLLLSDLPLDTAVSAVMASVHCMGPGLGGVGPASTYGWLNDYQLGVLTLAMLLGRLELLSFMVLFTAQFWRK